MNRPIEATREAEGGLGNERRRFLGAAALTLATAELRRFGVGPSHSAGRAAELASLAGATTWINSPPLTATGLRGQVVLVHFWTYTCINWMRSLPYVRAWADRYRKDGLVVIGVHTPEFSFEHDLDNVRRAVRDLRVTFPVAVDSGQAIWRGFRNSYWPALYFVSAEGELSGHAYGEGDYPASERTIQRLLAAAGVRSSDSALVSVDPQGVEMAADWKSLKSPENYLGTARTERFASPGGAVADQRHIYAIPAVLRLDHWAASGAWTMQREAIVLQRANGRIGFRFHARDLHLVMGAAGRETPVRFMVRVDGLPPGDAHGLDVDAQGNGTVSEPRMYQLIRQPGPVAERQFEITFLDPGVGAFAFTFG